ncbi:hypothetical protein T484DRAFT_1851180 [Baffinella frigidus]|nr:hypothetical protein T484DRAFT_1851180 [Cryptophyta sp. CCMP2293]
MARSTLLLALCLVACLLAAPALAQDDSRPASEATEPVAADAAPEDPAAASPSPPPPPPARQQPSPPSSQPRKAKPMASKGKKEVSGGGDAGK